MTRLRNPPTIWEDRACSPCGNRSHGRTRPRSDRSGPSWRPGVTRPGVCAADRDACDREPVWCPCLLAIGDRWSWMGRWEEGVALLRGGRPVVQWPGVFRPGGAELTGPGPFFRSRGLHHPFGALRESVGDGAVVEAGDVRAVPVGGTSDRGLVPAGMCTVVGRSLGECTDGVPVAAAKATPPSRATTSATAAFVLRIRAGTARRRAAGCVRCARRKALSAECRPATSSGRAGTVAAASSPASSVSGPSSPTASLSSRSRAADPNNKIQWDTKIFIHRVGE